MNQMNQMNLNWRGTLTVGNIEQVADLLRQLLGGKRYTLVVANEINDFRPKVRLHEEFKPSWEGDSRHISCEEIGRHASSIHIIGSYGVEDIETFSQEGESDHDNFRTPYIVFEGDRVTITHRVVTGWMVYLVFVVERE